MSSSKETINLITPSIRPQNLKQLYSQIKNMMKKYPNIKINWIIVHDNKKNIKLFNDDFIQEYSIYNPKSIKGNAQRNAGFKKINNGWIYLLDDDTTLVDSPFQLIEEKIDKNKIHSFTCNANNIGDDVELSIGNIDSGCFLFHSSLLKDMPFALDDDIGMCCNDGKLAERLSNIAKHQHHKGYVQFNWNYFSPNSDNIL